MPANATPPLKGSRRVPRRPRTIPLASGPMALGSGAASLAGVSTLMFVGSYLAGCLPALVKLGSPKQLQLVRPSGHAGCEWRAFVSHAACIRLCMEELGSPGKADFDRRGAAFPPPGGARIPQYGTGTRSGQRSSTCRMIMLHTHALY